MENICDWKYILYIVACQTHLALVKRCHVVRGFCQFYTISFIKCVKGSGTESCRRRSGGFYWRPRLHGTRQYRSTSPWTRARMSPTFWTLGLAYFGFEGTCGLTGPIEELITAVRLFWRVLWSGIGFESPARTREFQQLYMMMAWTSWCWIYMYIKCYIYM